MELSLKTPVLALNPGEVLALDNIEGASIKARCGTLWITQEGDPEDVVLHAGENFVVRQPGRTVIQAFDPAWVSIRERIGSFLTQAADALDRRRTVTLHTHESWKRRRALEEYIDDVRVRMHAGF